MSAMSALTFCSRGGERKPLGSGQFRCDENEERDCLQQLSDCPACKRDISVALILPCSHTMCVPCISSGSVAGSRRCLGPGPPVCSVLCPCCRRDVELPCSDRSSATSCLPKYPILRFAGVCQDEASQDHPWFLQRRTFCTDSEKHGLDASCSSIIPPDVTVDLQEEEMAASVIGLFFALDPSTAPLSLHLSNSCLTVSYQGSTPPGSPLYNRKSMMTSDPREPPVFPRVCADVVIERGQYYWEVDVCNCSIYRIGVSSQDGSDGWWLERQALSFCAVYDGSREAIYTVPPQIKTLGVFLNFGGGGLSFCNPLTQEHLVTLPTHFCPTGVVPTLCLGQGKLQLRSGLAPPPHVFLSKDSAYRGASGSSGGWRRREIPFKSVRKIIQKFEELAVSDGDSGLISSFGSSCSTLASLPDPEALSSGQTGWHAGAD